MGLSSLENILAITVWVSWVLTPSPYIFKFIFLPPKEDCFEDPHQSMRGTCGGDPVLVTQCPLFSQSQSV